MKKDIDFQINDSPLVQFEFDPQKEAANLAQHGVDFSTVCHVFDDPKLILAPDAAHSAGEPRFYATGFDGRGVLTVRFTRRGQASESSEPVTGENNAKPMKTNPKITYTDEPADGWKFDPSRILTKAEGIALGIVPNPPGTEYERIENGGIVTLRPKRGGARRGAGRKAKGHVKMLIQVSPEVRERIRHLAKEGKTTLSHVIEQRFARASG